MVKGKYAVLAAAVLWALPVPSQSRALAQSAGPTMPGCGGISTPYPMAGHYTGTWHSDGDYHFAVFHTDLDLKIIIDGTLDATIDTSGRVAGVVTGSVDAPVTHDGKRDVSSGSGSISGQITGVAAASGGLLLLSHPVIHMHWGTFAPGGYTVERYITMPDYQFSVGRADCVTGAGAIAETDFPTMTLTSDGTGGITQAPGVGSATGTWQLTSDGAASFRVLSQRLDHFLDGANGALSTDALSFAAFQQRIITPLRALTIEIQGNPTVSRCLLERLGDWEARTGGALYRRARDMGISGLSTIRIAGDLIRTAQVLDRDCAIGDGGISQKVFNQQWLWLDRSLQAGAWSDAALYIREVLLVQGAGIGPELRRRLATDLHAQVQTSLPGSQLLDLARIAFVFSDDADVSSIYVRLLPHTLSAGAKIRAEKRRKHHAKPKPKPTPKPSPKPTVTPTATATTTAQPATRPTLSQVLQSGISQLHGQSEMGAPETFRWTALPNAARYLVVVSGPDGTINWAWSGQNTFVRYGDTSIVGEPTTQDDGWPEEVSPVGASWSVVALDSSNRIVGALLRSRL